jgi:isoquinoline 1-oxidoreductase subunit beta
MLAVLDLAAQKAGWGKPLPAGRGRGIATRFSFSSYVAQVVEASVEKDGTPRVHRVVCAVDCGHVVNPDGVKA